MSCESNMQMNHYVINVYLLNDMSCWININISTLLNFSNWIWCNRCSPPWLNCFIPHTKHNDVIKQSKLPGSWSLLSQNHIDCCCKIWNFHNSLIKSKWFKWFVLTRKKCSSLLQLKHHKCCFISFEVVQNCLLLKSWNSLHF